MSSVVSSTESPSTVRRLARRWPVVALAAWNGFVFSTRISNVLADEQATSATKAWAIALATLMLVGAVGLLGVLVTARARPWHTIEARLVQTVAGLTIIVWVIRGIEIVTADYSTRTDISSPTGFKVVHLVLGIVAIVFATLSWRAVARDQAVAGGVPSGRRPSPVSPVHEAVR